MSDVHNTLYNVILAFLYGYYLYMAYVSERARNRTRPEKNLKGDYLLFYDYLALA